MAARILLVEDHADTAQALERLLARDGFEVHVAGLVSQAVALCAAHPFDLLLVDLQLPDGSAMTLPRQVRQTCVAPAIVLSADGSPERVAEARRQGFADYLLKPMTMDTIRRAIERVLPGADGPILRRFQFQAQQNVTHRAHEQPCHRGPRVDLLHAAVG